MEAISIFILVGAGLLLVSILTSVISFRIGAPLLLIFLAVGLLAGEDGIGGIDFDNAPAAFLIGSIALVVILFESGFDTRIASYRVAAAPALTLATVGVLLTSGLVAVAARLMLGAPWPEAFLLGAIVSSTDAAAVFFLLRVGGITIRERVRSTLEIESGSNDPVAIFLTITLIELIVSDSGVSGWGLATGLVAQLGGGAVLGLIGGGLIVLTINRMRLEEGLYPLVSLALALFVFAGTTLLGGSGFLAVYVAGLVAGNLPVRGANALRRFHNGLTWLSQIVMFLTLGLLATPSQFDALALPAIGLALALTFIARPLAVWLCLAPFRFTADETTFVAWVGLRGAVSILLAIVPILYALPDGQAFFNIAFIVVVVSLLLQGWTVGPLARWLGLVVPPRSGPVDRVELELPGQLDYELVAYTVLDHSPVAGGQRLPRWARPSLIIRRGRVVSIHTARQLQAGDIVYLFSPPGRVPLLDRMFAEPRAIRDDDRLFYGDLVLTAATPVATLAELYGLPLAMRNADLTLGDLFRQEFRDQVEVGDRLRMGAVDLIARELDDDNGVRTVGVAIEPLGAARRRVPVIPRPRELLERLRALRVRLAFRLWQRREQRRSGRARPNDRKSSGDGPQAPGD